MHMSVDHQTSTGAGSGILTIDLSALCDNYRALASSAPNSRTAAVVKADAYGLGADIVAPDLERAGCRTFFVAHVDEAVSLKPHLSADATIFVLNGLQPGCEAICAGLSIVPVLNSLEQVQRWSMQAAKLGGSLPAALQIDTGMSRLGLAPSDVQALLETPALLSGIDVRLLMSHLACADEPEHEVNAVQLGAMRTVSALFPTVPVSLASSAGISLGPDYHHTLMRPGIALYGGNVSSAQRVPMKPVVQLNVAVIQTRTVPEGSIVGYGATLRTTKPTRLATIAAGYADGIPRALSNRGAAYFNGIRLPIAGRVSMDSITIDISALPEGTLTLGSMVEIIGEHQSLEALADDADTIAYEILTRLGRRYRRRYIMPHQPKAAEAATRQDK